MADKRDCTTCGLAQWKVTKAGRLHPSGDGRCGWQMPVVAIASAFYYHGFSGRDRKAAPAPSGGHIERHSPYTDCPTWMEKTQ